MWCLEGWGCRLYFGEEEEEGEEAP